MARRPLTDRELDLLIEALAVAASRRESQARAVKFGRHHDLKATEMRRLRLSLYELRVTGVVVEHTA